MNAPTTRTGWPVLRRLLDEQWFLLVAAWAAVTVVMLASTAVLAGLDQLDGSVWEQASQVSRWFALFIGVYLTGTCLRLVVVHGQTRRAFMTQAAVFTVVYTAVFAALCAASFAIETALYRIAGWPQTLTADHLYASPTQYGHIFLTFWLTLAVWLATGAFIAAAFHRGRALGLLTIPIGLALISPTELAAGFNSVPFLDLVLPLTDPPTLVVVALCLAGFALALTVNWALIRHIPIRPRT